MIRISDFKRGFTLIELLVVISIIGILATLLMANLNSARSRGRDAERKSDVKNLQTALRLFYNDYGSYPKNDASYDILGCSGPPNFTVCNWGSPWTVTASGGSTTTYMPQLPKDPLSTQSYEYMQINTDSYEIDACLENASDPNGVVSTKTNWKGTCSSGMVFQVTQ